MEKQTKHTIQSGEQLLQARQHNLQQLEKSSLRPHGKLWGMDVFTWYNPSGYELENTLTSFPFPVIWFGNHATIYELLNASPDVWSNLQTLCVYDSGKIEMPAGAMQSIKNVLGTTEFQDIFEFIRAFKQKNAVFLFTASGGTSESRKKQFEDFLNLHQL